MKDETNKIINWIEMGYTRLNYKEELSLVDYIKQLQQENQSLKKENKILRENAEHNDKVVDKVNWENLKLKEHIEKYEHYCKTTGIEELIKNKKYKEENEFLKSEIEEAKRIFQKYLEYIDERDEKINKAIEYIENNPLYEEEYDYDYEENSYLSDVCDEIAKKDLLEILKGVE